MPQKSLAFLLVLCFPAVLWAGVVPLGDERVLAVTPDSEYFFYSPDSAARAGEFMVTWNAAFTRYSGSNLIDWGAGVYGRRVAADGVPAEEPLALVPEEPHVDIGSSAVAADAAGRYAVVWDSAAELHPALEIHLRHFGNEVSTALVERLVRPGILYAIPGAAVALGPLGRSLVVWGKPRAQPSIYTGLLGQIFEPSGQPLRSRFEVTPRWLPDRAPAVGVDARGNAIVVYRSARGNSSGLYLRYYDRSGQALSEVRLVTLPAGETDPALAMHPDGRFAVVWPQDGRIWLQLFARPYRATGRMIQVNTFRRDQLAGAVDVAIAPDGRLLVVWAESGTQGDHPRLLARGFDPQGAPLGPAVRIDRSAPGFSGTALPTVAAAANGAFLVSWLRHETGTGLDQLVSRSFRLDGR